MPKALVGLTSGGQVGKILFDTQNVYATGGPDFPRLGFVLDLHLSPLRTVSPGEQTQQPHPLTWMFLPQSYLRRSKEWFPRSVKM